LQLEAGILFFLDEFSIPPSVEFLEFIRAEMNKSACCAIFLGAHGWGKTHIAEARLALEIRAQRPKFRIIPVNLPGVPEDGWESLFGAGKQPPFNWIPLRNATDDEAKSKLIEAIHGKFTIRASGPEAVTPYYIRRQAALWERSGRKDNSALLAGRMLRDAQMVASTNPEFVAVNAVPAFLARSVQKERNRLRSLVAASSTAAVVAAALAAMAYSQRNEALRQKQVAEENARISQTRSLASIAIRSIGEDRADERALLLARQAYLLDGETGGKSSYIVSAALSEILATPYLGSTFQLPPDKVLEQTSPSASFLIARTMRMSSGETAQNITLLGPIIGGRGEVKPHRTIDIDAPFAVFLGDSHLLVVTRKGEVETRTIEAPDRRERLVASLARVPDMFAVSRDQSSAAAVAGGRELTFIPLNSGAPTTSKVPFKAATMAISSDGSWLAATDSEGNLRALRKGSDRIAGLYPGRDVVNAFEFASGSLIIVGERGGETYAWDPRVPSIRRKLGESSASVDVIAVSPNHHTVTTASGSITPGISIRDVDSGKSIGLIPGARTIASLRFTEDGRFLVSGSSSGEVRYWRLTDVGASRSIRALDWQHFPLDARLYSVVREPKRDVFLVGGDHGIIQRYSSPTLKEPPEVLADRRGAALATVPDVKRFEDGGRNFLLTGHVMAIGLAKDGTRFATVDPYGFGLVWDANENSRPPAVVPSPDISHAAFAVGLSPSGRRLVVGATSSVTFLHDLDDAGRSRKRTQLSSGGDDTVRAVAFGDEDTVIVGDDHGRVVRWRINEEARSEVLVSAGPPVTSLLVRRGRLFIGRGEEVDSMDLNAATSSFITMSKGLGWVYSLAVSDDGSRLAVGYSDGIVRMFATAQSSAQPVLLNVHRDVVRALAFDLAGDTLVSVGDDGMIRSTAVGEGRLGDLTCEVLWRDLRDDEISSYFGNTMPPTIPSCPKKPQ
jgi:WD40 repeat protein